MLSEEFPSLERFYEHALITSILTAGLYVFDVFGERLERLRRMRRSDSGCIEVSSATALLNLRRKEQNEAKKDYKPFHWPATLLLDVFTCALSRLYTEGSVIIHFNAN